MDGGRSMDGDREGGGVWNTILGANLHKASTI